MDETNKDPSENPCDDCGEIFTQLYLLKRHKQKVHGVNYNTCSQCDQKFPGKYKKTRKFRGWKRSIL